MRANDWTLAFVKEIYLEKVVAKEESNQEKLNSLEETYPELFNTQFLMDILRNEYERAINGQDNTILFKTYLFTYH